VWDATKGDTFDVLGPAPSTSPGNSRDYIRFHASGYKYDVERTAWKRGGLRDPYKPSIHGVGYFGAADNTDPYYKSVYKAWNNMMDRCYNTEHQHYRLYGGRAVRVCRRWHSFAVFQRDSRRIAGAYYRFAKGDDVALDKDHTESSVYSPDSCVWLPSGINVLYARTKPFVAISPTGQEYLHVSESAFAKLHGQTQSKINEVLLGKRATAKGWSYRYVDKTLRCVAPVDTVMSILRGKSMDAYVGAWSPESVPADAKPAATFTCRTREGGLTDVVDCVVHAPVSTETAAAYGALTVILASVVGNTPGTLTVDAEVETRPYKLKNVPWIDFEAEHFTWI
jgi:hypothetical protein